MLPGNNKEVFKQFLVTFVQTDIKGVNFATFSCMYSPVSLSLGNMHNCVLGIVINLDYGSTGIVGNSCRTKAKVK